MLTYQLSIIGAVGVGLVGSYGITSLALKNSSLIVWGPGFANYNLHVL